MRARGLTWGVAAAWAVACTAPAPGPNGASCVPGGWECGGAGCPVDPGGASREVAEVEGGDEGVQGSPCSCVPAPGRHVFGVDITADAWERLHADLKADVEVPVVAWIDGTRHGDAKLELHGGTARRFAKQSYRLTLDEAEPVDMFGATGEKHRHFVLQASWIDPTFLRNAMVFELVRQAGGLAPRVDHANLCFNGEWHGFYLVIERVDKRYLERQGLDPCGDLYKAENHAADWRAKGQPAAGYDHELGESDPAADLKPLLDAVTYTPTTKEAFEEKVEPVLCLDDFTVWQRVHTFAQDRDCYTKNYYLYHDPGAPPGSPEGRFRVISWDSDATFAKDWDGVDVDSEGQAWHGWDGFSPRLFAIPEYRDEYLDAYDAALKGPWRADALLARVISMATAIRDRAMADLARWQPGKDFDGEVAALGASVARRVEVMSCVIEGLRQGRR